MPRAGAALAVARNLPRRKINVYFSEKMCYTIFELRRAARPGHQKPYIWQAFSDKKGDSGLDFGGRLLVCCGHFAAPFLKGVYFWQKN